MLKRSLSVRAVLAVAVAVTVGSTQALADGFYPEGLYSTKTVYQPFQSMSTYHAAPAGFTPVFTQIVARHGSRGLSSPDDINFLREVLTYAESENAVTALGQNLRPQLNSLDQANLTLGYGELSGRGKAEHSGIAARLTQRLSGLLDQAASQGRHISVEHSGRTRARDSAIAFTDSLKTNKPALTPLIDAAVVNRPHLYFHAISANQPYLDWVANDPTLKAKLDSIMYSQTSRDKARAILVRLFNADFVDRLAAGQYQFTNPDTGLLETKNAVDVARALYGVYSIVPGLSSEGTFNFTQFLEDDKANYLSYLYDSEEYYISGPSFSESTMSTGIAKILLDELFNSVEAQRNGSSSYVAKLRFGHGETITPLVALMKLPTSDVPTPVAQTYTYQNNLWRAAFVEPYSANMQWDVYKNASGVYLVKMLYNELEAPFKWSCQPYQWSGFYYTFDELKRCYGY